GDPETDVVIPRLKTDLVELFQALNNQELDKISLEIDPKSAVTVMVVSGGYREAYEKGKEISGIENIEDSIVFDAGTKEETQKSLTIRGRVIAVTSFGENFKEALKTSYNNIDKLHFEKMYFRRDIGFDL